MKLPIYLICLLIILGCACANRSSKTAAGDDSAWLAKASTLPSSSYNRQQDSLLLLNYWQAFKEDVLAGNTENLSRKLPLDPAQKCLPLDSTFTEADTYWAFQTVLASWLEQGEGNAKEMMNFTLADSRHSMLVITNSYEIDIRNNLVSTHELKVYIVRKKNKMGITGALCQSNLALKELP